jgi:hypothetical protein
MNHQKCGRQRIGIFDQVRIVSHSMGVVLLFLLAFVSLSVAASAVQDDPSGYPAPVTVDEESPDSTGAPVADPGPAGLISCPGWLARSSEEDGGFLIDLPEWLEELASGALAERLTGLDDLQIRFSPRRILLGAGFDFSL